MADKVIVKLLRPLNGAQVGTTAEYDAVDAKRLVARGAVEMVKAEKVPANKMVAAPSNKSKAK